MKIFIRSLSFILASILFTACGGQSTPVLPQVLPATQVAPVNNPYGPQPGDEALTRGDITINSASLNRLETVPPEILLNFSYSPLTPCHQLRVEVTAPDAQKRINVSAYGLAPKDTPCTLVPLATPLPASLELGSFPAGHYSVSLNGNAVGEFDM
jgi:hypothetical protein